MPSPARSVIRSATRGNGPLNILTFPTHERYESNLAKTGHNFFSWVERNVTKPKWDEDYAAIPNNYTVLDPNRGVRQIPEFIDIDLVLAQSRFGQFQLGEQISQQIPAPLVCIEHTTLPSYSEIVEMPTPRLLIGPREEKRAWHKSMVGDVNVFISEYSRDIWGWGEEESEVIHHGVDSDTFENRIPAGQRSPISISVVNDWINRDWCCGFSLWEEVTGYPNGLPVRVFGATEGLSESTKTVEELVYNLNDCRIFVNTSTASPIPTSLLEAMSCGCAVVSTANCMIPSIIKNGHNGLCTNDPNEMRSMIQTLMKDPDLSTRLGNNARETIVRDFSIPVFVDRWNSIFNKALGRST